ncbi:MAG: hypothetical protein NTY38_20985, partial [Acidobacteria bacterium]|nr:hypothetical protein [Acidobacteriota bacterium]
MREFQPAGVPNHHRQKEEECVNMHQLKTGVAMAKKLIALNILTFVAVGAAFGQSGHSVKVEIPYVFTMASKTMPAGTYTFSLPAGRVWLEVRSATGGDMRVPILTRLGGPNDFRDGSFVFDNTGGGHILSEVWIPGTDGALLHSTPKGHSHEMLLL